MISYHTYFRTTVHVPSKVRKYESTFESTFDGTCTTLSAYAGLHVLYGYWHPNQSITYTKRFSLLDLVSLHFCSEFLCLCVILINPSTGVVGLIRSSSVTAWVRRSSTSTRTTYQIRNLDTGSASQWAIARWQGSTCQVQDTQSQNTRMCR